MERAKWFYISYTPRIAIEHAWPGTYNSCQGGPTEEEELCHIVISP